MSDVEQHLMTLFWGALDRTSDNERAGYLDEVCGQDPALRARVEALLRAHQGARRSLEPASEAPTIARHLAVTPAAGPQAGAVVGGRSQLLKVIGEGGMGTVWLAEQQEPVRRKVALKLIKSGMDGKHVLAR